MYSIGGAAAQQNMKTPEHLRVRYAKTAPCAGPTKTRLVCVDGFEVMSVWMDVFIFRLLLWVATTSRSSRGWSAREAESSKTEVKSKTNTCSTNSSRTFLITVLRGESCVPGATRGWFRGAILVACQLDHAMYSKRGREKMN